MGGVSGNDRRGGRQLLDPNRTARWGIGVPPWCLPVRGGPGRSRSKRAKKKTNPSRAGVVAAAFAGYIFIDRAGRFVAKGTGQRRQLTLWRAGCGMQAAVARPLPRLLRPRAESERRRHPAYGHALLEWTTARASASASTATACGSLIWNHNRPRPSRPRGRHLPTRRRYLADPRQRTAELTIVS